MGTAEQGGAQPQPVLLIGGPKHTDTIRLPADSDTYEFTSSKTLSRSSAPSDVWATWPENGTHIYKRDKLLSELLKRSIFVHDTIWNSPEHGGYLLIAIREAENALVDMRERLDAKQQIVSDRNKEVGELTDEIAQARGIIEAQDIRLDALRTQLELIAVNVTQAVRSTGRQYTSVVGSK